MSRICRILLVAALWLAVTVLVVSCTVSRVSNIQTNATNGTQSNVLNVLGRWHGGPVYASAVAEGHVFFGTGGAIRVLKITEGNTWQEIASVATSGVVRGLQVAGRYLYVADGTGALRIIDVSIPGKPRRDWTDITQVICQGGGRTGPVRIPGS